jgi:hypothetical protein
LSRKPQHTALPYLANDHRWKADHNDATMSGRIANASGRQTVDEDSRGAFRDDVWGTHAHNHIGYAGCGKSANDNIRRTRAIDRTTHMRYRPIRCRTPVHIC